jgi:hypothetical protein
MPGDLPTVAERLPFDLEYQKALLRLLCEDPRFAQLTAPFLLPRYFESEVLSWAWSYALRFRDRYGAFPTLATIKQETMKMDARLRPIYDLTLEQVRVASVRDDAWLRDNVLDFAKRNIFVRAFHRAQQLYNKNQVEKAYDFMMGEMERISKTLWAPADDTWFYEDLPNRQVKHLANDIGSRAVATGFDKLDYMMGGGLSKGELGIWVAYAKGGKSSLLMTHGVAATKLQLRPTAHFVFEGSRPQVEDRYEAAMSQELYREVRNGGLSMAGYQRAYQEYQLCRGKLYIKGFTDEWNYSVVDIHQTLKDLKRSHNWEPDLVIVDYGDLLHGREERYGSEREKQKAAFRDLKSLSNRGYAVWTASQAQRPEEGSDTHAHWIYSRMIADCYEKVRVADFIGSLNATRQEKDQHCMRIMCELYRDNAADVRFCVHCELNRMVIRDDPTAASTAMPDLYGDTKLGVQRAQASSAKGQPTVQAPVNPTAVQTFAKLA